VRSRQRKLVTVENARRIWVDSALVDLVAAYVMLDKRVYDTASRVTTSLFRALLEACACGVCSLLSAIIMAGNKITNFFKRGAAASGDSDRVDDSPTPAKVQAVGASCKVLVDSPVPRPALAKVHSAGIKTVRKWEKELNIDLGHKLDSQGAVVEIWCNLCRQYGKNATANVRFNKKFIL
jgi:hypothetical protein